MNLLSLKSLRSTTKTPTIHLNDLAPEVLAQIFDFGTNTAQRTLDLCTVCRLWNNIILSHPCFWTSLHVSIRGATRVSDRNITISAKLVAHFERWFSRAGDLPLEASIDFGEGRLYEPTEAFHRYFVQNSRWKVLRFEGITSAPFRNLLELAESSSQASPCWPILHHFILDHSRVSMGTASGYPIPLNDGTVSTAGSLCRIAPMLQDYTITASIIQYPFATILYHPSTNITTFETGGLGIGSSHAPSFITFLLSKAINLKCLRVRFLVPWRIPGLQDCGKPPTWTPCRVTHPQLEELRIEDFFRNMESGFLLFPQYLRLPRLRVLALSVATKARLMMVSRPNAQVWTLSSILTQFIQESQCELTHLRLQQFVTSTDDLLRILAQIGPTLKSLELYSMIEPPSTDGSYQFLSREWGARFAKALREARRSGQSVLPDLETFKLA